MICISAYGVDSALYEISKQKPAPLIKNVEQITQDSDFVYIEPILNLDELTKYFVANHHIYLIYNPIECFLSTQLESQINIVDATANAIAYSNELISLYRKHRKFISLINVFELNYANSPDLNFLKEHGWEIEQPLEFELGSSFFDLAAIQHINQTDKLIKNLGLLKACSIPLANRKHILDVNKAIGKHFENASVHKQTIDDFNIQLESSKKEISDLKHDKTELSVSIREKANKINALGSKLKKTETEKDTLTTQVDDLIKQSETTLGQVFNLQEELERQLNTQAELKNELEKQLGTKAKLKKDLRSKDRDLNKAQLQLTELRKELDQTNDRFNFTIKNFETENELVMDHLMNLMESYENNIVENNESKSNYEDAIAEATKKFVETNLKLLDLESNYQNLESSSANKQKHDEREILILQKQLNAKEKSIVELKSNTEKLQKQLKSNNTKITEVTSNVKKLQKQFDDEKTIHQKLLEIREREIVSLKSKKLQAERKIEDITNSTIWKVSTPVRKISGVINRSSSEKKKRQDDVALIFTSELFNAEWYLNTYPDVKSLGVNPAEHYLVFGAKEGRLPSPTFDGNWYLKRYPDVATSGMNPLLHYIKLGIDEGRSSSPKLLSDFSKTTK